MKKIAALAAIALIVLAGSQLASTVGATQNVSSASNVSISKRVSALERKVKKLQTQMKGVAAFASCFGSSGITQYGNPTGTPQTGYFYTNDGGTTQGITTALDVTESGQTPDAYFALINPQCLGASAKATLRYKAFKQVHLAPHAR